MKIHQSFFRGLAVAGLSLSIAAAQTTGAPGTPSPQQGAPKDQSGHVAGAAGATSPGESMLGKTDEQFMTKAAQGGMMEVQLAQMAQQKAASDDVKEFARKLEQDHSKANDQLKKIAAERAVQLPTDLGKHQEQVAKLQNLSGEEFDRAFMKLQVQHHKKDVNEFKKYQNRSMDTDLKEFASAQLPVLQQHYEQAQQLAASTGTRARQADKTSTPADTSTGPVTGRERQDPKPNNP